jgi:hypothetical protein
MILPVAKRVTSAIINSKNTPLILSNKYILEFYENDTLPAS